MFAAMFAIAVVYGLNHNGWQDDSDENDSSLCFWLIFLITSRAAQLVYAYIVK